MKVKVLNWNIRGLNDKNKRSIVGSLVREWRADIVCLQQTKMEDIPASMLYQIWGNRWVEWAELKASGTRGGIVVMWDRRLWKCNDSHQGSFSITCFLDSLQEDFRWAFTCVYGPHTNAERKELWHELGAVRGIWTEQWVVGGDFNVCRFENERLNCIRRSKAMRSFSDIIMDLQLLDLPLQGAQYTWARGEDCLQASRIDRFLISSEWNESFKAINQLALPRALSDHKPLLLESGEWDTTPSYFKFENMWLQQEGFIDMVKEDVYGKVEAKRTKALEELSILDQTAENRALTQVEKQMVVNLKAELMELAKAEEISWRQKSRCLWLKERDRNTRYFQTIANSHRRNNNIDKLKVDNEITDDKE
ncbi:uncharacterized protein [Nicotiana sylvestris]|uniref:uncharacterized protein n=1 Tax=Nicotiana sylvestris TaxID=4096 RepID=UPI00388C911C